MSSIRRAGLSREIGNTSTGPDEPFDACSRRSGGGARRLARLRRSAPHGLLRPGRSSEVAALLAGCGGLGGQERRGSISGRHDRLLCFHWPPGPCACCAVTCGLAEQIAASASNSSCASGARSVRISNYGVIAIFNYRAARSGLPLGGALSLFIASRASLPCDCCAARRRHQGDRRLAWASKPRSNLYLRVDIDMLRTVGLPVPAIASVAGGDHA